MTPFLAPDPTDPESTLTPSYNARGDLTSDGKFNYTYDDEDRMLTAEAIGHSTKLTFAYDSQGRRISEITQTGWDAGTSTYADSSTMLFAYSGNNIVAETDGSGNVLETFTWGNDMGGGIGGLLLITDKNDRKFDFCESVGHSAGGVGFTVGGCCAAAI